MTIIQFLNLILNCIQLIESLANECAYETTDFENFNDTIIDITPVVIAMLIFTVGYLTGIISYFVLKDEDDRNLHYQMVTDETVIL
jgi:hypothetical protein